MSQLLLAGVVVNSRPDGDIPSQLRLKYQGRELVKGRLTKLTTFLVRTGDVAAEEARVKVSVYHN